MIIDGESILNKPTLHDSVSHVVAFKPCSTLWSSEHNGQMLLSVAETLGPEYKLRLAFRTGKHFRYLAARKTSIGLGPKMAQALPMFHALTGGDTVSSIVGHGKKTARTIWKALPELTDVMLTLSCAPRDII